mmetsp:Transcript_170323/g.540918  ORF Transcript_170323/g.540918 Transcript_170323/m.540918 type:complete len:154 (-) Transcript_170323:226-687(-)
MCSCLSKSKRRTDKIDFEDDVGSREEHPGAGGDESAAWMTTDGEVAQRRDWVDIGLGETNLQNVDEDSSHREGGFDMHQQRHEEPPAAKRPAAGQDDNSERAVSEIAASEAGASTASAASRTTPTGAQRRQVEHVGGPHFVCCLFYRRGIVVA